MSYPSGFKYTTDHEWIELRGDRARVGITDYAQQQLGDIVYVELPKAGDTLKKGDSFGTIESVKAVAELYVPMSGEVVEVNTALENHPEMVNDAPTTWLLVMKISDPSEAGGLLDAGQYADLVK